jgi:hypothetical protein
MTRAAAVLWLGLAATGAMASDLPKLRTPVMADRPVLRPKVPIRSAPPIGSVSPDAGAWHTFVRLTASGLANAEGIRVVWFPGDDDSQPQAGAITATMRGRTAPDQVEIEIPADAGGPQGGVVRILAFMPKRLRPVFVARFTVGTASAAQPAPAPPPRDSITPPPTSPPKATARIDLRTSTSAGFGAGSIVASGQRVGLGLYVTLDMFGSYVLRLNPDAGGHFRVRATVTNIQGATNLLLESAEATVSCPFVRNPGYRNFQTCDLVFDLPSARQVAITVRKPADAVSQVTLVKFDVTRESPSGAALAAAQLVVAGPQEVGFDNLPGAKANANGTDVNNGAHVELRDNSILGVNLLTPPAGSYRFRAMISNTAATTHFTFQGAGRQATCDIAAAPGYQNATPCDLVVPVSTAGANLGVILRKQSGGAPTATVDTVYVYQE